MNTPYRWRLLVLAVTALLVSVVVFVGARVAERGEELAREAAMGIVARSIRATESTLNRHFLQVDSAVASLGPLLSQILDPDRPDDEKASRFLQELTTQSFVYRDLLVVRPDGAVWAAAVPLSRRRPLPLPVSAIASPANPGGAVIAGPVRNPLTGEDSLYLARGLVLPGLGAVIGVAEIPVSLLATVLAPLETPVGLRLRLKTTRGLVLAAGGTQIHLVGRTVPSALPQEGTGGEVIRQPSWQDGDHVFMAAVPSQYPGILMVSSLPETVALAAWERSARTVALVTAGLSGLVALLGTTLVFIMRMREAAERERAASRATLETAIEALPNGFVMWDADDRLVISNQRYRDFYAVSAPFLVPGARFEEIIRRGAEAGQYPQMGEDTEAFVTELVRWHRSNQPPFERELPDGRWILVAEQPIPGGGIVGIRTDITALKQTMAELTRTRDIAAAAMAARTRMVAHVSHELRTPLSALLRLTDHMKRDVQLSERQRRRADMISAAARHLLGLANEVLDLAAIEAGSLVVAEEAVDPRALAEEAVSLLTPIAEGKRVAIVLDAAPLPAAMKGDATRLRQVLVNLIGNAVKFGPPDSTVNLRLHEAGGQLRVEVTDEGPGVPLPERERLFADFVRLAPGSVEGTGLGLAISARLTALMGGRIGVGDNPGGRGAMFWVELPIQEPPAPSAAAAPARPLRLLAVDDAPANLSVLRALLSATGCELETVTEAPAALEILEHAARTGRPYDAVLMDVMMPGMDGLEATRRIRAMPGMAGRVPVIAVTAGAFPDDIAAAREAGMDFHVTKPIDRKKLLAALGQAVPPDQAGDAPVDEFARLRPAFLQEVALRLATLEAVHAGLPARATAAHALVAAVGHLGLPALAEEARLVMRALRHGEPGAEAEALALGAKLRAALPELLSKAA
ncbi:MAG: PAS-domain containing protein [Acetobacteraceae bacterium]|nr:PAS-domain containing protein [Acetobacteraceae bacterium]